MSKWKRIKVGYSDGSGGITDNDGAYLTTDDKDEDTVVIGGSDDWGCGVGVLQGDESERLVKCWNALLWSKNPEQDIKKLVEVIRGTLLSYQEKRGTELSQDIHTRLLEALSLYKEGG